MGFRTRPRLVLALWAACGLAGLAVPASLLAADPAPAPSTTTAVAQATATTATTTTTAPTTTSVPSTTTTAPAEVQSPPVAMGARAVVPARKGATSVSITDGKNPSDFGFSPPSISVTAGDTVTWTNTGSVPTGHTVTGSGFDSGVIHSGGTYSHTFTSPGTFSYHCSIHPFMKGIVTVAAAPASSPSGGSSSGGGSGGSDPTPTTTTTASPTRGPTSESAATASPDAAGSKSTLPMTGFNVLALAVLGGAITAAGLRLRRAATQD